MRIHVAILLWSTTKSFISTTMAFTSHLPYDRKNNKNNRMGCTDRQQQCVAVVGGCCYMVPLSNEEIFARAAQQRAQQEIESDAPPPSLYDSDMLQKMGTVLSLLDTRAVQGPQSLTYTEVEQLDTYLQHILTEMRNNQHLKPQRPPPRPTIVDVGSRGEEEEQQSSTAVTGYRDSDDDDIRVAIGSMDSENHTTNTYIIPNMEQMTPAEYQEQLQRTVIEHQNSRRQNTNIVTGNRATWDYMNTLGSNNAGILNKEKGSDDNGGGEKKNWSINRNSKK